MCLSYRHEGRTRFWIVWIIGNYNNEHKDFTIDNRTKEIAWVHVNKRGNCEGADMDIYNPDAEALEGLKKVGGNEEKYHHQLHQISIS